MSTDTLGGNTQSNVHSLFENKPSSESNQHGGQKPIVIAHGIKPDKNFHVSTDDVELRSVLEGSGGRYIKKYKAYRFPKKSEERVRAKIAAFLDSTDPVDHYLDDQIRTEATLEIGQTYRAGINGDQWILREFIPEIGEKGLRVKFQKYSP